MIRVKNIDIGNLSFLNLIESSMNSKEDIETPLLSKNKSQNVNVTNYLTCLQKLMAAK